MLSKLLLFFISVLMFMLIFLSPVQAISISIETIPLSESYRKLPVKIYWEYSRECPSEFNEVLKKTLDTAIILLRKSIYRFMEENDGRYDEFIRFRIEYVDNLDESQIFITGRQLGMEIAGITNIHTIEKKMVKAEIYYDCEVVLKPIVPAFNIVLHELLHGLGLGHTDFKGENGEYDIMGEKSRPEPVIYVSNLNLEALYSLWFRGYDKQVYTTSSDFQFKQIKPYVVELQELEEIYKDLQSKYSAMSSEVLSLKSDVAVLKNDVVEIKSNILEIKNDVVEVKNDVTKIGGYLEKHEKELRKVSEELNATEKFVLAKAGEYDYKFKVVGDALNETWNIIKDIKNVTISNSQRISSLEESTSRFSYIFTFILVFMAVILSIFIYLVFKIRDIHRKFELSRNVVRVSQPKGCL